MLKKFNDFLAGLPMTIVAGVFLLLDLVPHLMEELGGYKSGTDIITDKRVRLDTVSLAIKSNDVLILNLE